MRKLLSALLLSIVTVPALAGTFQVGTFDLYSQPSYVSGFCNQGTELILDRGKVLGEVAVLEDFVKGTCKVAVRPNTRFTKLTFVRSSCGSRIYEGGFTSPEGFVQVSITDHRTRLCKDLVPAMIIVALQPADGPAIHLYSQDPRASASKF